MLTSNWWTRSSTEEGAAVPEFDMQFIADSRKIANRWNRMRSGLAAKVLLAILLVNISNSWTAASTPRVSQSVTANNHGLRSCA